MGQTEDVGGDLMRTAAQGVAVIGEVLGTMMAIFPPITLGNSL